jgi:N-acetylglutamate synthase-like GNAT family acetyltransferase
LDYVIRSLVEDNDSQFCALWTHRFEWHQCAEIFVNKDFPRDYFFNKIKMVSPCNETLSLISDAKKIFFSNKLDCFFSIHDDPEYLEINKALELQHFSYIDTMLVFCVDLDASPTEDVKLDYDPNISQLFANDQSSICEWVDLFCESFQIEDWKKQVRELIMSNCRHFDLLVSGIRMNLEYIPAACAILYCSKRVMGLYCLGTLPKFRRKGLAFQIVKSSISRAKTRGMKFFFVQTFLSDGFAEMYEKAGLELAYRKRIYVYHSPSIAGFC